MDSHTSEELAFIDRLVEIIHSKLNDEHFGVSDLAAHAGMSRSALHRKIKKIKDQSVSQFIREVRLEKARELLEEAGLTVSEVAFEVGFGSPTYFSHCFHEHFGITPGEVRKTVHPKEPDDSYAAEFTGDAPGRRKRKAKLWFLIPALVILIVASWFIYEQLKDSAIDDAGIIVLPFKNLSGDQANDYFADGIREDILNNLYWITSLHVVSRTTSDQYRNTNLHSHDIARESKVRYLLEGTVRIEQGKARMSMQLIDAKKDDHLWSDSFDREMSNIIGLQGEIALKVANELKMVLPENEVRRIEKIPTQNSMAYDNYLQARFLLHQSNSSSRSGFNKDGVINSIPYYEKAIAEDPDFSEAYSGLANANMQLSAWGIVPGGNGFRRAYELSMKAIELDPECAEAYAIMAAIITVTQNEFKKGGEYYRKSIELNPNFATSRQWYSQYLMCTGPISEARVEVNRALELEPYFWVVKNLDAWIAYFEKDYERSLEVTKVARDLNPDFPDNKWLYFLNYTKLNQGELARDQLKEIAKIYSRSDNYTEEIDEAYAANGIDGLFSCMIDINKNNPIRVDGLNGNSFYNAWWYAVLENKAESLYWLEETLKAQYKPKHYFNLLLFHPDFEFLHNEPRFRAVVDSLNLSPYWVNVRP